MDSIDKKLSNTISTGGGGVNFENQVIASFVTLMLTDGFAPCLLYGNIKKILTQAKRSGYHIDDCVVFIEQKNNEKECKLLCQIKRTITIAEKNKIVREVINAAWKDFNNQELFTKGKDSIAIITGLLSMNDIKYVRPIFEIARSFQKQDEFFKEINFNKSISNKLREKVRIFREYLKYANNNQDVADEDIFQFFKHFHLLSYDFDIKAGVQTSLLHSLIAQYSKDDAHLLFSHIIHEVSFSNQLPGGPLTKDSFSDEIKDIFKKRFYAIPSELLENSELLINKCSSIDKNNVDFVIANLIGSWNDANHSDKEIINGIAQKKYNDWILSLREVITNSQDCISLKNGIWSIIDRKAFWQLFSSKLFDEHLHLFKKFAVSVLTEQDPEFQLPIHDRYLAIVKGKILQHSQQIRKGFAETLVLIANHPSMLKNCTLDLRENFVSSVVYEILSDANWMLWGSLNSLLPLLAEAAPDEFLKAIDNGLQKTSNPFEEFFSQESTGVYGRNHLIGLLRGLEVLAWSEEYLVRVTVILGELSEYDQGKTGSNRVLESLTMIFLPWFVQTSAPFNKRKIAIETLQKEQPEIVWKLLLSLMPSRNRITSHSCRPIVRDWVVNSSPKNVTRDEYQEQISFYGSKLVEIAMNHFDKLINLVGYFIDLTQPNFEKILEYLNSDVIKNFSDAQRTELWENLVKFIVRHSRYSNTDWALNAEQLSRLEAIEIKITPCNPIYQHKRLFSENDFELYENDTDWDSQKNSLEVRRKNAILSILQINGLDSIIQFVLLVKSPWHVGLIFGNIANKEFDDRILPKFLNDPNQKINQFAQGFIWGRYSHQSWTWVDKIDRTKWNKNQVILLFINLPFNLETWNRVDLLSKKDQKAYWQQVSVKPWEINTEIDLVVSKLIEHKRPAAAINCLNKFLYDKKPINALQAAEVLLLNLQVKDSNNTLQPYMIIEIIKYLQENKNTQQQDMLQIEWSYLTILDGLHDGVKPKLLEKALATEPDFFCDVIKLVYKSSKETVSSNIELKDEEKTKAMTAYDLLRKWKVLPGMKEDGKFSSDEFKNWLKDVKSKCIESGHFDMALSHIGNVLIYSPPDIDGLWINRTVAEALNDKDADKMRNGFVLGLFNSRGTHMIDSSGEQELKLAQNYKKKSVDLEQSGFYRFSATLNELANSYELESRKIVDDHQIEEI